MKKLLLLLLAFNFLACDKDDSLNTSEITGVWKLSETYMSPGGPAEWEATNIDKRISFMPDGTFYSNYDLCNLIPQNVPSEGNYSLENGEIMVENCSNIIRFELDNRTLQLEYLCIEPCLERYVKIAD